MSTSILNYNDLLKKTSHYDKDERYMAISDLCEALKRNASRINSSNDTPQQSHVVIDPQTERRICSAVLGLLDDKSNDVQTVAVKALGVLLMTVQEEQVVEIADRLCALVLDVEKSDLRDVYAIGLKTLVETIPSQMGNIVSSRLVSKLIEGVRTNSTLIESPSLNMTSDEKNKLDKNVEEIVLECLNIITDLLTRFGSGNHSSITNMHDELLNVTLGQLASSRPNIRKRAGSTIGVLATVISDTLLHRLVDRVLEQIDRAEGLGKSGKKRARNAATMSKKGDSKGELSDLRDADTRSLIRTICTVSGMVGHRLNQGHIDGIVPIFLRFCDPDDALTGDDEDGSDEEMEDTNDNNTFMDGLSEEAAIAMQIELRESCFAGFESFILRCPALIQPHLDQIVQSAMAYMRYDPNYSYGDENGDDDIEEDEDLEEIEEDEYSDEDDMSDEEDDETWKVRRSAIRTLTSIVEATRHDPSKLWVHQYNWRKNSNKKMTVAGALVNRFKERDENCRVDNIECFTRLLSYTVSAASAGVLVLASPTVMYDNALSTTTVDLSSKVSSDIVTACEKQLSAKKAGERSKSSAIALLSTLCHAPGGIGGSDQFTSVFQHIKTILSRSDDSVLHRGVTTSSKALKLESLKLVRVMLSSKNHDATEMKGALISILLPEICMKYDWYKVIAEALRVLNEVPHLVILGSATEGEQKSVANSLFIAIEPRLEEHDLDQEIKECALSAAASLMSLLHLSLTDYQKCKIFQLTLDRLKNDTTRVAAIKTLSVMADAAQKNSSLDLSPIMHSALEQLSGILRQSHRSLKQSSLECLDRLVLCLGRENSTDMDDGLFGSVLGDLGKMISPTDLHLCSLGCSAATSIMKARPSTGALIESQIFPAALQLSNSPLLQEKALVALMNLFGQMVLSNAITFDRLYASLAKEIKESTSKGSKQVIYNLAECIATISIAAPVTKQHSFIQDTINEIDLSSENVQLTQLQLLVTGNIGRKVSLSSMAGVTNRLKKLYNDSFESSAEEIKHASALALGRASAGSMDAFLPDILSSLQESTGKKQYLLLSSLREFIHCYREAKAEGSDLSSSIPLILPHLEKNCENEAEGVRTMVAECFGSLACVEPATVLSLLLKLATNEGEHKIRVKWTVGNAIKFAIGGRIEPNQLVAHMHTFLLLLQEDDLDVKNVALLMVYSAVHHTPQLVAGIMKEQILPTIFELAQLNMERTVDLGPFKHKVDDALPLRKTALSIVATCLEKCPSCIDIPAFMPVLAMAMADVEDIQLQAHQIVISMCSRQPMYLVAVADSFVGPLEKTVNKKKGGKTGTELERVYEWIKSGLRVMLAIAALDGAMNSRKFADFVERIKNSVPHRPFLTAVQEEH